VVRAGEEGVPTRSSSVLATTAPYWLRAPQVLQPGVAAVRCATRDAPRRSARCRRPWLVPRQWLDGTASATWPCRRGCTGVVGAPAAPQAARTDPAAGSPDMGQPHPGTTRECRRLRQLERPIRSAPLCFGVRVNHGDHASLALALRGPGRAPRSCALVRAARVFEHAPNRAGSHLRQTGSTQTPLHGGQ
jgi:hypothetical protein